MGGFAWVTLATNDSYSLGALVLAHSLKQVGTKEQLAVLVTPGVTNPMREKLASVFNVVQEVNILDSRDEANLKLLKRPELGVTFTKLHCWRLVQFDKCVFLDADTLVLQNCDELFEKEELAAAPDVGWPDCFNSGVFVYKPSNETYEKLVQFALDKGSFDGGDQGLLNLYFSDWATKDISKHLPFIYNLCSTACYSYLPAFKQFGGNAKIIHFIGAAKPWLQYFDTETRKVRPSEDLRHLEVILQHWWNIFCSLIHPNLTPEMGGLAGAFAQLTLGAPRTAEQSALDDHLRRQGWEVGNIDYMGRDSFDNIWSKICETLGTEQKVQESSPTPIDEKPIEPASEAVSQPEPSAPAPEPQPTVVPEIASPQCPLKPTTEAEQAPQCPLPAKAQEVAPTEKTPSTEITSQPAAAAPEPSAVVEVPQPAAEAPKPAAEAPKLAAEVPQPAAEAPQPAAEAPQPVAEVLQSAAETLPPAVEASSQPVTEAPQPATEPVATATKPVATVTEPVATVTEPVATVTEPVATATEPVQSAQQIAQVSEPPKPISEVTIPSTETAPPIKEIPVAESVLPVVDAPKPTPAQIVPEAPVAVAKPIQPIPEPAAAAPKTVQEPAAKPETPQPVPEEKLKPTADPPKTVPESASVAPKLAKPKSAKATPAAPEEKPKPTAVPESAPKLAKPKSTKTTPEAPAETTKPTAVTVPKSAKTAPETESAKQVPKPAEAAAEAAPKAGGESAKSAEASKPKASKEVEPAPSSTSPTSPTPPPRKTVGGTKKPKAKK